ncbi:MAG: HPr(Ser) kinase/phosphatase [Gammaproteobacteria bacterium]|nr:HPr(Ser) kinase/phosphatase [Gammaproteobacteria bacterium]
MPAPLTIGALFDVHGEKLALEWLAGRAGTGRVIEIGRSGSSSSPSPDGWESSFDPAVVGHLNLIHPNRIQVLGRSECRYLQGLGKNSHDDAIGHLFDYAPAAVIVADGQQAEEDLLQYAERTATPLLTSRLSGDKVIDHLHYYLISLLAEKITLHGVFMEVLGIGVLLTGESGVGKSELALELVSRGHCLIADDAPEFSRIAPETLEGSCPEVLRDFLEVRGLGILNVRAMFGDSAIKHSEYLRLIIHLRRLTDEEIYKMDRLRGEHSRRTILDVEMPQIMLPVAPGRNLAVLVEGAVRNHILSLGGYRAAEIFMERQQQALAQGSA